MVRKKEIIEFLEKKGMVRTNEIYRKFPHYPLSKLESLGEIKGFIIDSEKYYSLPDQELPKEAVREEKKEEVGDITDFLFPN